MNDEELRLQLDKQEAKVKCNCEKCQKEIYEGENYYETDEFFWICEDCMDKELSEYKKKCERIA